MKASDCAKVVDLLRDYEVIKDVKKVKVSVRFVGDRKDWITLTDSETKIDSKHIKTLVANLKQQYEDKLKSLGVQLD